VHHIRIPILRGIALAAFATVALPMVARAQRAARETPPAPATREAARPAPLDPTGEYAARRASLFDALDDGVILVLGAPEPRFDYLAWQQARPFRYLTGFLEPEAALVMVEAGPERHAMLFAREKNPAREVWDGARLGVLAVRDSLGVEGREISTLRSVLDLLLKENKTLHVIGDFAARGQPRTPQDQFLDAIKVAHPEVKVTEVSSSVALLRGKKSRSELALLRTASEISARGHVAVMHAIKPGIGEFQIEAIAEAAWRAEGADGPGYESIVGSGPNSTTLHYNRNGRIARDGELIVMDMAASFAGYAADITRTVPVSGRFTPAQRELYTLVLDAHKAAERQVRAGGPSRAMTDSSNATLRQGLAKLGLIESPDATYDCGTPERARQCPQLGLYYMHGLGHGIGLDVHDPDQYYTTAVIDVGSAFTIEPGVYVRANLMEIIPDTPKNRAYKAKVAAAFARYAGMGVRIEDDYLVTAEGVQRVSAGVPREIDEIEREMAKPRTPLPVPRTP
jgi:Xaa-Pro aminopeptidase